MGKLNSTAPSAAVLLIHQPSPTNEAADHVHRQRHCASVCMCVYDVLLVIISSTVVTIAARQSPKRAAAGRRRAAVLTHLIGSTIA